MKLNKNLIVIFCIMLAACVQDMTHSKRTPKAQPVQGAVTSVTTVAATPPASASSASYEEAASDAFKVAVLVPLSGEGKALGQAMLNSAMLALADQAGYVNLPKDKFVIIPKDTGATPALAVEALSSASRDGAEIALGPIYSGSVQAVMPAANQKNIPVLSFSNNGSLAGQGAFLMGFAPEQQLKRAIDYAIAGGRKSFAALLPNDAYGNLVAGYLRKYFSGNSSVALVDVAMYPAGTQDISIDLAKLAGSDAANPKFDALLMPEGGRRIENLAAAITKLNLDATKFTIIGSGQWDDDNMKFPEKLEGAIFAGSDPSRRKSFEAHYAEVFGSKPPRLASLSYDATSMLVSYAAGGLSPSAVKSRLATGESFLGPVDGLFKGSDSGVFERGLAVLKVSGGSVKVLDAQPDKFTE